MRPPRPILIGNEIYRRSSYGAKHPLAIPRVSSTLDLIRAMGWLEADQYWTSDRAEPQELQRFHAPEYVAALLDAERAGTLDPERRARFNIGRFENPIFPEIYSRPATAAGGTMMAARHVLCGGIAFNPAGGTHHGRPDRASGFCYVNDPALGILTLLDGGLDRIVYVDLDAHHCDGVEDAFARDPRVVTISIHEDGRWPMPAHGRLEETQGGTAFNLPVPAGFCDDELDFLMRRVVLPLVRSMAPQALVVQAGADALADDPLSRLSLSNLALWRAVGRLASLCDRVVVLGGGGYNPWSVARAWAGVWAVINGIDPAVPPTVEAVDVLRSLTWSRAAGRNPPAHWFETIADQPRRGSVRSEIARLAERVAPAARNVLGLPT